MVAFNPMDGVEFVLHDKCEVLCTGSKDDIFLFMICYKDKRPIFFVQDFIWEDIHGCKYDFTDS